MSTFEEVTTEELEALESIYVDELEKISEDELRIRIDSEDDISAAPSNATNGDEEPEGREEAFRLYLNVKYTPGYPDEVPNLKLESAGDTIDEQAREEMLKDLKAVAEESLGMAMVFTLASHMRESLTDWIHRQKEAKERDETARREAELEAEQEKFRGTAVTTERFMEWRRKFEAERRTEQAKQEEEKLKGMTAKEREEHKRWKTKPSGKELFAKGTIVESAAGKGDEADGEEIDWSLYSREERERLRRKEEEEAEAVAQMENVHFDSDDD
ncbi:RWD-domain-containing protein [Tilletiaria anomala UBC 951]|uniref:RWD-domain-containing protein n=1 Tax=Tilletiaria anomala (strain ATCC 24038 / CBS 436.72 / UBC 951) TaxID=1037660 RepID=A0A066VKQ7_TILAU|nr:RWD-domain-containing protein [Tilletiaria anomala UBC 951]KDN42081.1 RWD-domain-containing protein [Tilletiaria anomala UBC 951]